MLNLLSLCCVPCIKVSINLYEVGYWITGAVSTAGVKAHLAGRSDVYGQGDGFI